MKQFYKLVWMTTAAFALVMAMGATTPASAQPQVAAGYQFLNMSASGASQSFPIGWFADVAFPLNIQMLSVVGSVDGSYKGETVSGANDSVKSHAFMGGVRYSLAASGMMTPFAQVLFGGVNTSVGGLSGTDGAIDIGGGINWGLNDQWTARVGVDYRRIMGTVGTNVFRVVAGVVIPIGG